MEKITDINQVRKYVGKVVYIVYDWHWHTKEKPFRYILNQEIRNFRGGCEGFHAAAQVGSNGVHGMWGISSDDIEKGDVWIRVATPEEIESIEISYGMYKG
jgi:hypothetical protein